MYLFAQLNEAAAAAPASAAHARCGPRRTLWPECAPVSLRRYHRPPHAGKLWEEVTRKAIPRWRSLRSEAGRRRDHHRRRGRRFRPQRRGALRHCRTSGFEPAHELLHLGVNRHRIEDRDLQGFDVVTPKLDFNAELAKNNVSVGVLLGGCLSRSR